MTTRRSFALRYSKASATVASAFDGTTSKENFGNPSSCGTTVGRQLLKNFVTDDIAASTLESSAPITAEANIDENSARLCVEKISRYIPVKSSGSRENE